MHEGRWQSLQVAMAGLRPSLPAHTPPDYRALCEACWAADPQSRCVRACVPRHRVQVLIGEVGRCVAAAQNLHSVPSV